MKDVDVTLAFLDEDARTGGKSHSSKPKQTKPCFQWCNTSDFTVEHKKLVVILPYGFAVRYSTRAKCPVGKQFVS
jgi:hypothetical protein